jgi:hypothetical protein
VLESFPQEFRENHIKSLDRWKSRAYQRYMRNDSPEFKWLFGKVADMLKNFFSKLAGKKRPIKRGRLRILSSESEEDGEDSTTSSSSEDEAENKETAPTEQRTSQPSYKIPRRDKTQGWNADQIANFKLNWPHLRNFDDSVLIHESLSKLTAMGRQKLSSSKLLTQVLLRNYETVQNFPEQVEAGSHDCLGKAHPARFLRGYMGDAQELWLQAKEKCGATGIEPVANYEVVSTGVGDCLTQRVWAELHKPSSRALSIRMLSPKSVEETWKNADKSDSTHEFKNLHDFKMAMASLEGGFHRVSPWNLSFKTLHFFLLSVNYGENDLSSKTGKLSHLANFVDEILRGNARNWEEKKKFFSYKDLTVKWSASLARLQGAGGGGGTAGKKSEKTREGTNKFKKIPGWVCRRFNEGRCD